MGRSEWSLSAGKALREERRAETIGEAGAIQECVLFPDRRRGVIGADREALECVRHAGVRETEQWMRSDGSTDARNASTSTTQAAKSRFKACTQPKRRARPPPTPPPLSSKSPRKPSTKEPISSAREQQQAAASFRRVPNRVSVPSKASCHADLPSYHRRPKTEIRRLPIKRREVPCIGSKPTQSAASPPPAPRHEIRHLFAGRFLEA